MAGKKAGSKMVGTITLQLPLDLEQRARGMARAQSKSVSEVIREALRAQWFHVLAITQFDPKIKFEGLPVEAGVDYPIYGSIPATRKNG